MKTMLSKLMARFFGSIIYPVDD